MREWPAPPLPAGWTASGQPPFVGRREEVAALDEAWSDARRGIGRAVFVSGEPGSGKSRLLSVACTRIVEGGGAVLFGSCVQEFGRAFEPFDQALASLLARGRADASGPAELAAVESAGRLLEGVPDAGPDAAEAPGLAGPSGSGREPLFDAVVDLVVAAADARPFVLALDDLQWAGPDAIQLLVRLVERTADRSVLVVGALRNTPPDRSAPLAAALARLARMNGLARFDLAPLSTDEIADYVAIRGGLAPAAARLPAAVLGELTGGNPFLLRAMWRPVLDADLHEGGGLVELPDSVGDLVRARLARLDPAHRPVLELAAVLGQEVELVEILGMSTAPVDVTLAAMDALVAEGLLEPPRAGDDRYRFPHAIARQAILDLVPATAALRIHAHIAQTLEADFPTAPRLVQRLAHHYTAARALGFGDRAVTYLARAAELAVEGFAYEDAGRLSERAAEISPDTDERSELLLLAADRWTLAPDTPRARDLYERVAATGNPRLRVRAAIGYEDASWRPGLLGHRAVELLTSALASIPPDEADPLYIEGQASLARATAMTGGVDEAVRRCDRAIELARRLGDPHVLAFVLRAATSLTFRPQGVARRLELLAEFRSLVAARSEWRGAAALHQAANAYLVGDREVLEEAERDLVGVSRAWGRHWTYWLDCVRFGRALTGGRLVEAEEVRRRAQTSERQFRDDADPGVGALQDYLVRRETGGLDRVRGLLTGEESPAERWATGLLSLYTEFGMREPVRRVLDWMLAHGLDHRDSSDWPVRLAFLAEAAVLLGDAETAGRLHPWLEGFTGLNLMSGFFVAPLGAADRYLGDLESVRGSGDPLARYEAALALAERTDSPLDVAYALASTARHLERVDPGSAAASEHAERARAIAEPAGLVRVLRMLDGSAPASGSGSAEQADAGALTPREVEVIALIAEGLSNRDIAARLVISEHTAANHVRAILTKTGATNRTQAARFAHERGLASRSGGRSG